MLHAVSLLKVYKREGTSMEHNAQMNLLKVSGFVLMPLVVHLPLIAVQLLHMHTIATWSDGSPARSYIRKTGT